jgi:polysaccharide pyruvyl transferase WcaK-like protein
MRLHALIFAAMNAVPTLGLSYDPKVEAFMKTIAQPYLRLDKDLTAEELKNKIKPLLAEDKRRAARLARKARDLRTGAELNFKLFFEYCRPAKKQRRHK